MAHVLLVMRKRGNLKVLDKALSGTGFTVSGVTEEEELGAILGEQDQPDAAIVDVSGYRSEVWRMCQALQQANVPFLVISEASRRAYSNQGLEYGARSVLEKPLVKGSLIRLLEGLTKAP